MASGLLLQARGVSCTLGIFTVHFYAFISHTPFLAPLVHVVGPLRAAAPLTVDKAPSTSWKGPPASPTVVYPGFLPISIIVLGKKNRAAAALGLELLTSRINIDHLGAHKAPSLSRIISLTVVKVIRNFPNSMSKRSITWWWSFNYKHQNI